MKNTLTIAGSDSCGGAGIQADLKTFSALGTYGMSVITAVTAQNTCGVFDVEDLSQRIIENQIDAIFKDIPVDGLKIGMVSQIKTIESIHKKLLQYSPKNIVLDPVMISKSGFDLLKPDAKESIIKLLIPLAEVVTPNIPEACAILENGFGKVTEINDIKDMEEAVKAIHSLGAKSVLLKGGHLSGDAIDMLYDGKNITVFNNKRIPTKNTHGTGCTLSSAICAYLARGFAMNEAVSMAKEYVTKAIKHSLELGKGVGPTNHFYELYKKAGMNFGD